MGPKGATFSDEPSQRPPRGTKAERLDRGRLSNLPKGDARKARITSRVRSKTTVPLQWLPNELHLGMAANILHPTAG